MSFRLVLAAAFVIAIVVVLFVGPDYSGRPLCGALVGRTAECQGAMDAYNTRLRADLSLRLLLVCVGFGAVTGIEFAWRRRTQRVP